MTTTTQQQPAVPADRTPAASAPASPPVPACAVPAEAGAATAPALPAAVPPGAASPAGNPVLRVPPAAPAAAAAYFAAGLAFHTDVSDVAAALAAGGDPGFTLVDTRGAEAWAQGHIAGAVHLPTDRVPRFAAELLDPSRPVVVHCWGPGCNGAARAALALAVLGYQVKEMLGGMEYWIREGFAHQTSDGPARRDADPLTAPVRGADCGC